MHKKSRFSLFKGALALGLMSALGSTSALAAIVTQQSVQCGTMGWDSSTYGGASCSNNGSALYIAGGAFFDYKIRAKAAASYVFGGLRTNGDIYFEGLVQGQAGAYLPFPAGTFALAQYQDRLRFIFPNAAPGSSLTMKSMLRFHGNNYENVDESVFYDGNHAAMSSEFIVLGFGVPSVNQMASFLTVTDGQVTARGSADITNMYTKLVTLDANGAHNANVILTLSTSTQLINGFRGSVGIGKGSIGADFSSTAGVLSIEFFDDQNQLVDYELTSDTGEFAFLQPPTAVPVPAAGWLFVSALLGLAGKKRLSRR